MKNFRFSLLNFFGNFRFFLLLSPVVPFIAVIWVFCVIVIIIYQTYISLPIYSTTFEFWNFLNSQKFEEFSLFCNYYPFFAVFSFYSVVCSESCIFFAFHILLSICSFYPYMWYRILWKSRFFEFPKFFRILTCFFLFAILASLPKFI